MQSSNAIIIDLQVNKSNAKAVETEMTNIFSGLQRATDALKEGISEVFTPAIDGVQKLNGQIDVLTSVLASATLELQNLAALLTTQHEETMWSDFISQGIDSLALILDICFLTKKLPKEWIVNAAVTAWKTICTTASIVTKAFGVAMNSLLTPTVLVVAGIAALIAIIALLIVNWDKVSAALVAGWNWVCDCLSSAAKWFYETVIQPIAGALGEAMDWIGVKVKEGFTVIQSVMAGVDMFLQDVFAKDWTEHFGALGNVLNGFFANMKNIWNAVKSIFSGVVSFIQNVFAGDWGAAWDSIVSVFKGIWEYLVAVVKLPINTIIGLVNGLVQGVVDGINLVIGALNGIHFEIPDWIPGLGGMSVGFQIQPLNAPKIPYLARGAVLPANKPFLAVLGDQRHGNNIEAPEGLIRDIFKEEMGDFLGGMMAGFEALLAENRSLRAVVECIEVGDTTIGQAANRYNDKMAIVRGRA